jgi:hypothetical protein
LKWRNEFDGGQATANAAKSEDEKTKACMHLIAEYGAIKINKLDQFCALFETTPSFLAPVNSSRVEWLSGSFYRPWSSLAPTSVQELKGPHFD